MGEKLVVGYSWERRVMGEFDQSILYTFMTFSSNKMIFLFHFTFHEKKIS